MSEPAEDDYETARIDAMRAAVIVAVEELSQDLLAGKYSKSQMAALAEMLKWVTEEPDHPEI